LRTNILVIGGSPAGIVATLTSKQANKEVTVARRGKFVVVPCGIPYIFGTLRSVEKDRIPDEVLTKNNVNLVIDVVVDVDLKDEVARLRCDDNISFEKPVLAIGSNPSISPIGGVDLENVFLVYKDPEHLSEILKAINECERIG